MTEPGVNIITILLPGDIDVDSVVEEELDGGDLAVGGGPHEHGQPVVVGPVHVVPGLTEPLPDVVPVQVALARALVHVHVPHDGDVLCGHIAPLQVGQDGARLGPGGHTRLGGPERP